MSVISIIKFNALIEIELEGIDTRDYPDFVDAFVVNAYHPRWERELNEDELDWVNENCMGEIQELALSRSF